MKFLDLIKRFSAEEDIVWFEKTLKRVVEEDLGERFLEYITTNVIYVDFLR
jgi:hypothetical protein